MWRSAGVESVRIGRWLATALALTTASAVSAETGNEAFARQDYVAATALWRAEADQGSIEAIFGLGLVHDLGLGVPRDSEEALRWYLQAARSGLAEAQFNVAVMLDSGTGAPSDPATAATWYARAAANENARAQYNLALLYEGGFGVPRNADMARVWLTAASPILAAAAERLALLAPAGEQDREQPEPRPVIGAIVGPTEAPRAEMVWIAEVGSERFRIQVARRPEGDAARQPGPSDLLQSVDTDRSAIVVDLPAGAPDLLWRIGHVVGANPTPIWSPWSDLSREPVGGLPMAEIAAAQARVTIYVNAGDETAEVFAEELSAAYAAGGVEVSVEESLQPAQATSVEYGRPDDADLAASVAELLPAQGSGTIVQVAGLDSVPGEVILRLVGGPRPVDG